MRTLLRALVFVVFSTPALATDGVMEINQACVATGCFPGDAPGYPVEITSSGSYLLTSNLSTGTDSDGLYVGTARVIIDFNGFSLVGAAIGSGTGNGITGTGVDGAFAGFMVVKNGVIRGFRALGIAVGGARGVRIEDMTLEGNAGGGAEVGDEAMIERNGFSSNGGIAFDGLVTGAGSLLRHNVVARSGRDGISAGEGSTLVSNSAYLNGRDGIHASVASTVSDSTAYQNGDDGIVAGSGSTVSGNTASANGGDGIETGIGSTVQRNTVRNNGRYGLYLSAQCAYRENTINGNSLGTVTGVCCAAPLNLGSNACNGSTTCP